MAIMLLFIRLSCPPEAQKVTAKLRSIPGFTNLEEEAVKDQQGSGRCIQGGSDLLSMPSNKNDLCRCPQHLDGRKKMLPPSTPIKTTYTSLYAEFKPVMVNSLNNFGALDYYGDAVNTYNKIPFVEKVNPDLADYVATKAPRWYVCPFSKKELGIRSDISQRTSGLLRKVFARQDR